MDEGDLRPLYSGSETNVQVKRESETRAPVQRRPRSKYGSGNADACAKLHVPAAWAVQGTPTPKIALNRELVVEGGADGHDRGCS